MTHDLAAAPFAPDQVFDVCVVGAGAAGIVLAVQLLRAGRSVALIESGAHSYEASTQALYQGKVTGQAHTGIHEGRFRTWGGTTTRWGGQILELEPIDFARRDWVPNSGWPFAKEELTQHYETALRLEGLGSVVRNDAEVWRGCGTSAPDAGKDLETYLTRWCPEPDFARLHGRELAQAETLTTVLHANLFDVCVDSEQAAQHAEFRSLNGHTAIVRAQQYVLAIGAIETSRILLHMAARSADDAARWNPNDLVGRGFQDHVDCEVARMVPHDRARFLRMFGNVLLRGLKYQPKVRLSAAAQERLRVLNVATSIDIQDASGEIAASIKATAKRILRRAWSQLDAAQIGNLLRHLPLLLRQSWSYAVHHRVYSDTAAEIALRVHCEQRPDTVSRVGLTDEVDALGMRRIALDWQISAVELDTMRAFTRTVQQQFSDRRIAALEPVFDWNDDAAFRAHCDDGLHHMGGAVMSIDPAAGVVDADLRMHTVPNVSLCSAAVFPTGGYSNPTHTLLALAVRLAHRLSS